MKQFFFCFLTMIICLTAMATTSPNFNVIAMADSNRDQNSNETANQTTQRINPWLVTCVHSSMPNPSNNDDQLKMKICKAEQTVVTRIKNKPVDATATISSIITNFTITNLMVMENSAALIIHGNKPIPLNVFCNKNHSKPTCSLMIKDKELTNHDIMSALSHANSFKIQVMTINNHRPINIEFSLTNFNKINQIILSADNHIKNIFQLTP